ncbi:hypothetical protein BAE44_0011633 [Dichanthelium oligosanthes]|uniref:Uncharacterized protein n=1 Tax=Dichanthelium oligosanthes TaxID=888268 RepID=A0A1E5VQD8_9POAL|nr:hypothetical protein BAE44_0011633 [Dichanthelium oligosanthes]
MPSSSSFATAGGAIHAGSPSTLSANAAPYTLLARQGRAPPGRLPDGDASRLIDDNFVLNGEDSNSYSVSLATHFGMSPSDTLYPSSGHGIRQSQPSSSCGIPASVYPFPSSSIAKVSEPLVTIASDSKQHRIPLTSGKVRVTIRSPPNKTSETDNTSFGSISKLAIRQNDESNKETGKVACHIGDASRLIDDNFVLNGDDNNTYSVPLATHFGMKPSDAVYPSSGHEIHQSQPSSSCGIPAGVYPSPSSSIAKVSEPSVTIASDFKQHRIPLTSGKVRVTIRSPPNKTSETGNTSFGSIGKLAIRKNDEPNKETGKVVSFRGNLEVSKPANGNGTSQGTMVFLKELNPEFSVKPHGPSACASPCLTVADDVNPDPSECSVDSPCWRGTASRLSPFDVPQTLVAQSVKQESVAFDAGQERSSSTDCEAPTKLQNPVACMSKQNYSQYHVEFGLPKNPGDIGTNLTQNSHGKELEFAKHGAEKCNAEKHCLEGIDDGIKQSGLNSAAPDFIPLSVRKSNTSNGSCSSSGSNISGILKAIKSMSEVLCDNYSDEIELEEHDYSLLQSVIENLQSCLHKARKVPVKGASEKAGGLKACYSQNAVSKSVTGNYNGSYTADNGKGVIISNLADSSRLLDDLRKKCMIGYQPSLNNFPKDLSCEEDHLHALIYKKLWIDAEHTNCVLKYQLKQTHMEIDLDSGMAHIGGGPRIPSFHLCDMGAGPSSSYGSAITRPPMLTDHPGARKSHNLLYAADCIQSEDSVLSRSEGYITVPKNFEDEYFLSGLEETGVHCHVHRGLEVAPKRAHRVLDASTSDVMPSLSHITGRDGISFGSCGFGSSDWEHVLKEEIGST